MAVPTLVISHPPHGAVDTRLASRVLDLLPAEAGLKAGYQVPEIWLAPDDPARARSAATELGAAGCRVTVAPGEDLRDLPAQVPVEGVSFTDAGLVAALGEGDVRLPYDLPLVAVVCTPRVGALGAGRAGEPDGTGAWGTFVDLYAAPDGPLRRVGALEGATDFTALAGAAMIGAAARFLKFVAACEARLVRAVVDRRLTHLQLRRRQSSPPTRAPPRKGFSFATPALTELLVAISPTLRDVSQCELSSRLVYLTRR